MKATTWLCPVLTLLCATRLVCTAQRGYPLDYADSNLLQDDYLLDKRNKPSLSIVNPLDVLRQRLLLEIARRQMKENTRQVELNRAILKNVGKRMPASAIAVARRYQRLQQQHPASPLDFVPASSIFDFLQRPDLSAQDDQNDKKSLDIGAKQQPNGNDIGNETSRDRSSLLGGRSHAAHENEDGVLGEDHDHDDDAANAAADNDRYQLRYLYRMHQNHFTRK